MHIILLVLQDFMCSQLAVYQHKTCNLMAQRTWKKVSLAPGKWVEIQLPKYLLHRCVLSPSLAIVSGLIIF